MPMPFGLSMVVGSQTNQARLSQPVVRQLAAHQSFYASDPVGHFPRMVELSSAGRRTVLQTVDLQGRGLLTALRSTFHRKALALMVVRFESSPCSG
jgi:hypothetical protein